VTRFNSLGSALIYSSLLGGQAPDSRGQTYDIGAGIALDSAGNAFIAGSTQSTNFPTKNAFQPVYAGGFYDAFVAKMDVRAVSTITLTSSLNPSIYGQPVTFTAAFASTIGAPPDGETVKFMKGKTILGTGTLSSGSASFTTSTLPVATNAITAVYAGDSNFGPSTSNTVKQVVNKATTTTALVSSANPSTAGQSVTFTATITPQYTAKVTGNVTFYDGTTALKTVAVSSNAAKFTTSTLASGSHNITAMYNGSTSFTSSSASLTQQVN
jgi:Bacterial Ig-like domain (group 3)/Beta-propeller repeat